MNEDIKITDYYVTQIKTPRTEYILGHKGQIKDEGSFYRIDGSYIIDKFRIKSMEINENKLTIHLNDEDIILIVKNSKEIFSEETELKR
ncbi:MAG: hypothetical protein IJ740_17720 [Ruminococcus sp.]|nr:hypothetical protein [Ruminococcus sp.]